MLLSLRCLLTFASGPSRSFTSPTSSTLRFIQWILLLLLRPQRSVLVPFHNHESSLRQRVTHTRVDCVHPLSRFSFQICLCVPCYIFEFSTKISVLPPADHFQLEYPCALLSLPHFGMVFFEHRFLGISQGLTFRDALHASLAFTALLTFTVPTYAGEVARIRASKYPLVLLPTVPCFPLPTIPLTTGCVSRFDCENGCRKTVCPERCDDSLTPLTCCYRLP